jgi:glucan 1,3-beta-glucosidase
LVSLSIIEIYLIGYWAFFLAPGDPFIQGFAQYLDQAITWAQQTGLKVWIDLHGAPGILPFVKALTTGSQNGFDNSGRRGPINWGTGQTIAYTQQALSAIVTKYSAAPYAGTVVAIEILNEPDGYVLDEQTIMDFYGYGISIIRQANNNMLFVMQDAFLSLYTWASFPSSSDIANGVIDTHHYEGVSVREDSNDSFRHRL